MLRNNNFLIKTSKAKVMKPKKKNEFRGWGDRSLEKSDCPTPEDKGSSWKRELI